MYGQQMRFLFLLWSGLCVFAFPAHSQTAQHERFPVRTVTRRVRVRTATSSGIGAGAYALAGARSEIRFQYVSDSLWNLKSEQKERFASWNRFRGTVDIDFVR